MGSKDATEVNGELLLVVVFCHPEKAMMCLFMLSMHASCPLPPFSVYYMRFCLGTKKCSVILVTNDAHAQKGK